MNTDKVTRVEVIDGDGRSYTNTDVKNVRLALQDDGRTLKVFCEAPEEEEEDYFDYDMQYCSAAGQCICGKCGSQGGSISY
jgi:hypothetical protein